MKRLTERWCAGGIRIKGCSTLYPDVKRKSAPMASAIARLAAYEDTWLEPEEVTAIKNAIMGREIAKITEFDGISIQRLRDLAQAEKDGRLVAYMPGDKVYDRLGTPWIVESSEIHLIGEKIKHLYRCGHPGTEDYYAMYEEEIQTREEAEAALKKREEDNENN